MKEINNIDDLEVMMAEYWQDILSQPLAEEIQSILASGDRKLYALWLTQVAHLTRHTSAHQALVGTRIDEISFHYAKYCFNHAEEEVGHEMMAVNDLQKIGSQAKTVAELPAPLAATEKLNAFLYYLATKAHPASRLGFSYWAEKCYTFVHTLASTTKESLGLTDGQMTFFVSHAEIDEAHAEDVEKIIKIVCKTPKDWEAVAKGMINTLDLATQIFVEIHQVGTKLEEYPEYFDFISSLEKEKV
jgi:hypothetical protein